jgi:hypothetical protein
MIIPIHHWYLLFHYTFQLVTIDHEVGRGYVHCKIYSYLAIGQLLSYPQSVCYNFLYEKVNLHIIIRKRQHIKLNYQILNVYYFMACHRVSDKFVCAMDGKRLLNIDLMLGPSLNL